MIYSEKRTRIFRHLSGFWSEERNLSVLLGIIIFDIFFLPSAPVAVSGKFIIALLNNLVFSLLLLFGVLALTRYKILQAVFSIIVALIIAVHWGRLIIGTNLLIGWDIFLSFLACLAFIAVILGHVYKEGPVTSYRIQGAVAAYLLIAMAFALAFFLIENFNPRSFEFAHQAVPFDDEQPWRIFYYFSICNLTTLGYGDITPIQPVTQNLVISEALIGQLYPAILLARLVSLHANPQPPKNRP